MKNLLYYVKKNGNKSFDDLEFPGIDDIDSEGE